MATTLAPVDSREVLRCDYCLLVQFRTNNNLCRKCKLSLETLPEEPEPAETTPVTEPNVPSSHNQLQIASAIRAFRQRIGLSQRQLAMRMQVPRTYVSKIENDKATPTLSSLTRLAVALEVSVPELLDSACNFIGRQKEIDELMADPFIAEMVPFVAKLDALQRSSFLAQIRDLSVRPRRTS
jgi:transcriptional regulator with XRE-family HTH domain